MSPCVMWMGGGGGNTSGACQCSWHCDWFKQIAKLHHKLQNCTNPSALPPLSPWLSNKDHFLSTLQKSYFFNLVSSSVWLMMLSLERLRWDSMWACVWRMRGQALSHMMGPSARAGWGNTWMSSTAWAVLLQVKKHLEIFHLWDSVGTGGENGKEGWWMGIAQPGTAGKEIHVNPFCLTPLNFWADHSLYKSLKSV